jgi:plastocyanin
MHRNLTKLLFATVLIVAVAAVACGGSDDSPTPVSSDADIVDAAPDEDVQVSESVEVEVEVTGDIFAVDIVNFQHQSITVEVGTTVKWTNQDQAPHTVTSGKPGDQSDLFDTRNLGNKGMFQFTFDQEGEIAYFCRIHLSMTATITVVSDLSSVNTDVMEKDDSAAMESAEAMAAEDEVMVKDDGDVMVSGDDAMAIADDGDVMVSGDNAMPVQDEDVPDGDAKVAEHVVSSSIVGNKLQDLTVEIGTAVEWKNDDQIGHTSTSGVPGEPDAGSIWDSGTLILDKTFTHTFGEEGEFVYFCRFHPTSMRATITVVAANTATDTTTDDAADEVAATDDSEATGDSGGDGETVKVTDEVTFEIQPAAEPEPVTVSVDIIDFQHQDLTIEVGTTVTWTNRDTVSHTTTSGTPLSPNGLWDSELLSNGATFSHTFDETGDFAFFCIPHSFMKATVTVIESS